MCGILGILPAPSDSSAFQRALASLAHRGPDGEGSWTAPAHEIRLGHRLLSIQGTSSDNRQPFHFGPLSLTYNGEIYNFPELRHELEQAGHRFRTQTDTEVLAAAWLEWGWKCLRKFNGMWAFGIWDERSKTLFLARDRFGQKPLYYHSKEGKFAFASEMKALAPFLPQVRVAPDFETLKGNLEGYESGPNTWIEGISRFPAGHWGEYREGKLKLHRWWNTLDELRPVPGSYSRQVGQFRELFQDACRLRMRADVPLGTALSGGVDSTAVLCTMARVAEKGLNPGFPNQWQHAFVASLPNTAVDETSYAKQVTDYLKIPATFVNIDAEQGLRDLKRHLFITEDPWLTAPSPMMQTYAAASAAGIKVTVDGHGADELFAGYDTFLFHSFLDCGFNPFAIHNILRIYRGLIPPHPQFQKPQVGWKDYRRWVSDFESWKGFRPKLGEEINKIFEASRPDWNGRKKIDSVEELGHLNAALFRLFHAENLPSLLRNYDRYSMASGVEVRMPFLDHRLVSFCFSLPYEAKIRNGFTKTILRDAVAPWTPRKVIRRRWKMGFQSPLTDWLPGPWKEWLQDIAHSQALRKSALVDGAAIRGQVEDLLRADRPGYAAGEGLWRSLVPFLWEEYFLKELKG